MPEGDTARAGASPSPTHDLAVVIVSANSARWLRPCLTTVFEHAGSAALDVVVSDNASSDGTCELVEREFPAARVVSGPNKGFAHGNNRALVTCNARYVLFLNPDTEVLEGTFGDLVEALDRRPRVGLAGVKQVVPDGAVAPSIRRFPSPLRAFGEAFGYERLPFRPRWLGERELNLDRYERETACDWTSGSFMVAKRETLEDVGLLDEQFFMYAEETDLCYRIRKAGWEIRHLPLMTVLHHGGVDRIDPLFEAQAVFARLQFARKHFSPVRRAAYVGALYVRHLLRAALARRRREASRRALRVLLGRDEPPFGAPLESLATPCAGSAE